MLERNQDFIHAKILSRRGPAPHDKRGEGWPLKLPPPWIRLWIYLQNTNLVFMLIVKYSLNRMILLTYAVWTWSLKFFCKKKWTHSTPQNVHLFNLWNLWYFKHILQPLIFQAYKYCNLWYFKHILQPLIFQAYKYCNLWYFKHILFCLTEFLV